MANTKFETVGNSEHTEDSVGDNLDAVEKGTSPENDTNVVIAPDPSAFLTVDIPGGPRDEHAPTQAQVDAALARVKATDAADAEHGGVYTHEYALTVPGQYAVAPAGEEPVSVVRPSDTLTAPEADAS